MLSKAKELMSCVVTLQLICAFDFAYAEIRFSHDMAMYEIFKFGLHCCQELSQIIKSGLHCCQELSKIF